jgi:hypothetical protein
LNELFHVDYRIVTVDPARTKRLFWKPTSLHYPAFFAHEMGMQGAVLSPLFQATIKNLNSLKRRVFPHKHADAH